MYYTKFYELLKKAKYDEVSMVIVINKIMPLINKLSLKDDSREIDQDLRSDLIEHTIKIIKGDEFAERLAKEK